MRRSVRALSAVATASLLLLVMAGGAAAQTTTLAATLSGDQEVAPGTPGSATETGTAIISVDPSTLLVCFTLTTNVAEPITASHIHTGAAGVSGDIVVGLTGVPNSSVSGSWTATATGTHVVGPAAPLADIVANPSNYYVNFHTATAPGGHVRGQLSAAPSGTASPCPASQLPNTASLPLSAGPSLPTLAGVILMALAASSLVLGVAKRRR
jgi:hypothetical protein